MATAGQKISIQMASCKCLIIRHSLHRRRRHRRTFGGPSVRIIEAAVEKAYRAAAQDRMEGSAGREKAF